MKKMARAAAGTLAVGAAAAAGWCMLLRPRRNQPGWEKFQAVRYAHRGLHNATPGVPENSLALSAWQWKRALERSWTCI